MATSETLKAINKAIADVQNRYDIALDKCDAFAVKRMAYVLRGMNRAKNAYLSDTLECEQDKIEERAYIEKDDVKGRNLDRIAFGFNQISKVVRCHS